MTSAQRGIGFAATYRFPDGFEFMIRIGELFGPDIPRVLDYLRSKHGEPTIVEPAPPLTSIQDRLALVKAAKKLQARSAHA